MSNREGFLENKIASLERRLTRIEKFVEIRFCQLIDDSNVAKQSNRSEETSVSSSLKSGGGKTSNLKLKRGKGVRTRAVASSVPDKLKSRVKECYVRISKISTDSETDGKKSQVQPEESLAHPYGTRRKKRIAAETEEKLSVVESQEDEACLEASEPKEETLEEEETEEDDVRNDYFIFPSENYVEDKDLDRMDADPDDREWSGAEAEEDDDDKELKRNSRKAVKSKLSKICQVSQIKRRRPYRPASSVRLAQKTKKKQKRPCSNNPFGSLSMFKLSTAKVVSTDPSRGECPICHRHYIHELLPTHVATHTKEKHLKCTQCDKMFWKLESLKKHSLTVHDMDNYKRRCRHCGKPIIGNLLHHEQYCLKKAWENDEEIDPELLKDIQTRVKRLGREFVLPDKSQQVQYDPDERKECPHCGKSFLMEFYDRHVKSHGKARNWKCSKCAKAYIHKHDLVRHMIQTHENKPTCEVCNATFETRNDLHLHNIRVCGRNKRKAAAKQLAAKLCAKIQTKKEDSERVEIKIVTTSTITETETGDKGEQEDSASRPSTVSVEDMASTNQS